MKNVKIRYEDKHNPAMNHFVGNVDEHASLAQMRRDCPNFFAPRHAKRETFTIHRGQIIVRGTVSFFGGLPPVRKTVAYLYFVNGELEDDMYCILLHGESIRHAKKVIDRVLESGILPPDLS